MAATPGKYRLKWVMAASLIVLLIAGGFALSYGQKEYRGLLRNQPQGARKIKHEGGRTFVWAGGDKTGDGGHWYDFTGAPMAPEDLQFGIGKDRIRAIDDPYFVSPDDPRLLELPPSPYRPMERPKANDEIPVIGYVENGIARAYPTALLDHHELVNDRFQGKPITVGW